MPVPRLQVLAIEPALRNLQKMVVEEFQGLKLPERYTPLKVEEAFQKQVKRVTSYAKRFLELMRRSLKGEEVTQGFHIGMFGAWMRDMDKFTSIDGLRRFRHRDWCRSRNCIIYGCQFRTRNDEGSITVCPRWLDIVTGPHNVITGIYYLEEPRW